MRIILKKISKIKLLFYIVFSLLYSLQGLLTSFLIQIAGKIDIYNTRMILSFGFIGVFLFIFIYACMYMNNVLARAIVKDLNIVISKKAIQNFYSKNLDYTPSELNSFLTQDIPMFWQEYLVPLIVYPIFGLSIIASVLYLIIQNFLVGLLFTIGGFLMIIPQFVFNKILQRRGEELSSTRVQSMASITDFTNGIDTIRSNQAGKDFSEHVLHDIIKTEKEQYRYFTSHNLVMFWSGPLKGIGLIIPLVVGLFLIKSSSLTLTTLLAMMTASMNLISPLQQLLEGTSSLQSATAVRDKVISILEIENREENYFKNQSSKEKLRICVENLSKSFEDKLIFEHSLFEIPFGKRILLFGASGSGKSTLFRILSGEDIAFSGSVCFKSDRGNCYVPSYDNVSLIHQKPFIFNGSVRDNLTLFQDIPDKMLQTTLQKVNLFDEIDNNLDRQLDGKNLSGGQMMKLEIARCLLRPKPILLVDEVTAALDEKNAKVIRELIYSQNCTVIEIAHKFNTDNYDGILKLENYNLVFQ